MSIPWPAINPPPSTMHLTIIDTEQCQNCAAMFCLSCCPSQVFTVATDFSGAITLHLHQERCLECSACSMLCSNIFFAYPAAGGVTYYYG